MLPQSKPISNITKYPPKSSPSRPLVPAASKCYIFGPYLPSYTESDFYELEIGSAGIMRGYMSRPCDKYFTLEKKLARFLSMSLNAYAVPAAEQKQVLDFIAKLDIRAIAVQVMQELFKALAMRFSFPLPDSVKA